MTASTDDLGVVHQQLATLYKQLLQPREEVLIVGGAVLLDEDGKPRTRTVYPSANIVKASGPTGYSAEVELLEGWDKPNRRFNFSNSASYNKFYFDYTGPNYTTQVGEVFKSRARYRLDTKN